jgi:REP-associated tyrosine transposase
MARPLRIEFAGAVWHVTSRGNEQRSMFRDDQDRRGFLEVLARVVERFHWRLHAFVLMTNHYHLLLETPEPTLSRGMRELNGIYTQRFNRRHKRVGHLLQGRFKSILVEKEAHLLELTRYVVLNPVRAGIVPRPERHRWSNYRATAGLTPAPRWLDACWTVAQFSSDAATATRLYREFVEAGMSSKARPLESVRGQVFLGTESFRREMLERVRLAADSEEIPRSQRLLQRPSLEEIAQSFRRVLGSEDFLIARKGDAAARAMYAYIARTQGLERFPAIGRALTVRASWAARLARRGEAMVMRDESFRREASRIIEDLASQCRKPDLTPSIGAPG